MPSPPVDDSRRSPGCRQDGAARRRLTARGGGSGGAGDCGHLLFPLGQARAALCRQGDQPAAAARSSTPTKRVNPALVAPARCTGAWRTCAGRRRAMMMRRARARPTSSSRCSRACNAAIAGEGCWAYVIATPMAGSRLRLTVSDQMDADARARIRLLPHLGIGVSSRPAIACSDGYVALLRLLWIASGASGYIPRHIAAGSPPERSTSPWARRLRHRCMPSYPARAVHYCASCPRCGRPMTRCSIVSGFATEDG